MSEYVLMKEQPPEGAVFRHLSGDCDLPDPQYAEFKNGVSIKIPLDIAHRVTGCENRDMRRGGCYWKRWHFVTETP